MSGPADPGLDLTPLAAEDHVCPTCPLDYARTSVTDAAARLAALPTEVVGAVAEVPSGVLDLRPEPEVWSVVEYVCHLRDVYVAYTIRLHRARKETQPAVEPLLNDFRARRFRYRERQVEPVLEELAAAVRGFRDEIAATRADEWDRVVTRLPSERRTARWLVRQALHEGLHHLADIRSVGERAARAGGGPGR
ncbi:DinB family protein [Geodermatophilus sp. YIM 151500]|uniref:DinB family protein n=1 Tax=Geodermatophilus sp. YIM 151500 TaxID=2984531 RepID=UPI0021E467B6|nr:DinB family protein [Geodermatophilus sp. YIM 151500]MCV2491299.1 DinB family protein [Geodermatophilus sp. YIM 151500]